MQRFAVIGLGRFGSRLATNLAAAGQEVIAIDKSRRIIEEIRDQVTLAVALDATDEQALLSQGIDQIEVAIVGIGGHFEAATLTTVVLKEIGVPCVISRAVTMTGAHIMKRIGADDVVNPEDESADRWAVKLANPWFLARFELDEGHSIVEIKTPASWSGQSLLDLNLRSQLGLQVVAIRSLINTDRPALRLPIPNEPLSKDDVLILLGQDGALAKIPQNS